MAKYRDWVSIKRLGIRANTRPEEIVHHLAAIRSTIDAKSYPFLSIKTSILDDYSKKLCQGRKKSYASLGVALAKMANPETKKAIAESASKELAPIAETYLLGKVISTIGYDTAINQTQMSKIFPDLKVKKPLGAKSKKEV